MTKSAQRKRAEADAAALQRRVDALAAAGGTKRDALMRAIAEHRKAKPAPGPRKAARNRG